MVVMNVRPDHLQVNCLALVKFNWFKALNPEITPCRTGLYQLKWINNGWSTIKNKIVSESHLLDYKQN